MALIPLNENYRPRLEFMWVDGNTPSQVIARQLASKGRQAHSIVDDTHFIWMDLSDDFRLAAELFAAIGSKNTTRIASNGMLVNKSSLRAVFDCYYDASRMTANRWCSIDVATPAAPSPIDLSIRLSVLGITSSTGSAPTKRTRKRIYHPCKLCFARTHPKPTDVDEWPEALKQKARETHADLCAYFVDKLETR